MPPKDRLNIEQDGSERSFKGFLGLLSFSTILPLNIHISIQEMVKFTWLWPLIGGFIGIFVGLTGFVLMDVFTIHPMVAAALIYSFAIWFTGFHHLDGLIDFGDGVMAHGDPQRRVEVMRDQRIGTGGLAYFFMVALVTFASIGSAPAGLIFPLLFVSEMAAKVGIVTCSTFSKPLPDGTGKFFIEAMNLKLLLLSLLITLAIGFIAFNTTGILGIIGGLFVGVFMALVANRKFKGATGDILGASNEISRMVALVIMTTFSISLIHL
jgi:adenosylcobinamide-GDP ribazoletransferase